MKSDFEVYDDISVCLLTPNNEQAWEWVNEHVPEYTSFGGSICVERRYIEDICIGILEDSLTIEKDGKNMRVQEYGLYLDS